jgi:hypothetical protein
MSIPSGPNVNLPTYFILPGEYNDLFRVKLQEILNQLANAINAKGGGYFLTKETPLGGSYIPIITSSGDSSKTDRAIYRKVVDFGALPNTSTKSVAHGISTNDSYSFVRIYGTATDPGVTTINSAITLPFSSSTAGDIISVSVDGTNVNITTASDKTAFTRCFIVLEYLKTM